MFTTVPFSALYGFLSTFQDPGFIEYKDSDEDSEEFYSGEDLDDDFKYYGDASVDDDEDEVDSEEMEDEDEGDSSEEKGRLPFWKRWKDKMKMRKDYYGKRRGSWGSKGRGSCPFKNMTKPLIALINRTQEAMRFLLAPDNEEKSTASLNRTLLVKTFIGSAVAIYNNFSTEHLNASQSQSWCNYKTEEMLKLINGTYNWLTRHHPGQAYDMRRVMSVKMAFYKGKKIVDEDWCNPEFRRKHMAAMKARCPFAKKTEPMLQLINSTYHDMQNLPPQSDEDPSSWMKRVQLVKVFVMRAKYIMGHHGDIPGRRLEKHEDGDDDDEGYGRGHGSYEDRKHRGHGRGGRGHGGRGRGGRGRGGHGHGGHGHGGHGHGGHGHEGHGHGGHGHRDSRAGGHGYYGNGKNTYGGHRGYEGKSHNHDSHSHGPYNDKHAATGAMKGSVGKLPNFGSMDYKNLLNTKNLMDMLKNTLSGALNSMGDGKKPDGKGYYPPSKPKSSWKGSLTDSNVMWTKPGGTVSSPKPDMNEKKGIWNLPGHGSHSGGAPGMKKPFYHGKHQVGNYLKPGFFNKYAG